MDLYSFHKYGSVLGMDFKSICELRK